MDAWTVFHFRGQTLLCCVHKAEDIENRVHIILIGMMWGNEIVSHLFDYNVSEYFPPGGYMWCHWYDGCYKYGDHLLLFKNTKGFKPCSDVNTSVLSTKLLGNLAFIVRQNHSLGVFEDGSIIALALNLTEAEVYIMMYIILTSKSVSQPVKTSLGHIIQSDSVYRKDGKTPGL